MKKIMPFLTLILAFIWSCSLPAFCDQATSDVDADLQQGATPTSGASAPATDYDSFTKAFADSFVVQYDKFKKETNLITTDDFSQDQLQFTDANNDSANLRLQVLCAIPDKITKKNTVTITLWFRSHTDQWRWLDCKSFIWLVDNKQAPWDDELYKGDVDQEGGGVEEYHTVFLTVKQFDAICKAQTIEFQACNENLSFAKEHLWTIKYANKKLHEILAAKSKN